MLGLSCSLFVMLRVRHTGKTPPPYTPPPILSPMRSGTGLFRGVHWRPHSANSSLSTSLPATKITSLQQEAIPEEPPQVEPPAQIEPEVTLKTEPSIVEPVVEEEEAAPDVPAAPETDTQPHINIGPDHQASLPALRSMLSINYICLYTVV